MKDQVLVEILVGLPGSGKTYYAQAANNGNKFLHTFNDNTCYVDFDSDFAKKRSLSTMLVDSEFGYAIVHHMHNYNHWIMDGLFLTNESQTKLVDSIFEICKQYNIFFDTQINIQFVYFKEDREACLYNDSFREESRRANITIKNAEFEKPDIDKLNKKYNPYMEFSIKEQNVHKMDFYEVTFKIHESDEQPDEMRSEEWCLGGTWGNCWGDSGNVGADEQPTEFEAFDNLLTKICPNITLLQYKKLYKETVSIETRDENDYYGGSCTYAYYKCDLKKLYDMLIEMKLIENFE